MKKIIRAFFTGMMMVCCLQASVRVYAEQVPQQEEIIEETVSGESERYEAGAVGWVKRDGHWYYYDQSGRMKTGWLKYAGKWYYLSPSKGYMLTGLWKIGSKFYYFTAKGVMVTGWKMVSGKWYYFTFSGAKTGWFKYKYKWYYFSPSKAYMLTGLQKISNKYYFFSAKGFMMKGWQKVSGRWYYFTNNGSAKTGWFKYKNKWYYFSPSKAYMLTGLKSIGSNLYYFASSGAMQKGWRTVGSYRYYFTSSGAAKKGWLKYNTKWYFLDQNGRMVTGLQTIGSKKYYFTDAGIMYKGWKKISGTWYYFGGDGACVTGKLPWPSTMKLPKSSEISAFSTDKRSPYIVCEPVFDVDTYGEYAVDFRADYLPYGTYLSVCNFDLTLDSLRKNNNRAWRDYNGVAAYAGFQVLGDGSHVAIMSVWDTYYRDSYGNMKTIRAQVTYPEGGGKAFDGEGNGQQCIVPYEWKQAHKYRALIQCGKSSSGTTTLQFWVCDLETKEWKKLIEYDTLIEDQKMTNACAFLENYLTQYAGKVRSMELWNIRVSADGGWHGATSASMYVGQFKDGSYNYGSYGRRFWAITTGLKNRCSLPDKKTVTVSGCDEKRPY